MRRLDAPGQAMAVPGYSGALVCPEDRRLCVVSCLASNCGGFAVRTQVLAGHTLEAFNATVQTRFRRALAGLACFGTGTGGDACVNEGDVELSTQEAPAGGRRAGAGVLVNVTLPGLPSADAAALVAGNLTGDRINAALAGQGLPPVTVTQAASAVPPASLALAFGGSVAVAAAAVLPVNMSLVAVAATGITPPTATTPVPAIAPLPPPKVANSGMRSLSAARASLLAAAATAAAASTVNILSL
jgi:hypothetical protein